MSRREFHWDHSQQAQAKVATLMPTRELKMTKMFSRTETFSDSVSHIAHSLKT
jgi:hypothetical protein